MTTHATEGAPAPGEPTGEYPAERLGERIGRGRTADVYAWGSDRVLKLFHASVPPEAAAREALIAASLARLPVPAPRFYGTVHVDGRPGLVFERVKGTPMLAVLARHPWLVLRLAQQFADAHLAIHAQVCPALPPQRAALERAIAAAPDLPPRAREAALGRLATLSDGDRVCHGDFHPDNVLITVSGLVVIDWITAVRGVPAADVARTRLLFLYASLPAGTGAGAALLITALRRLFFWSYWRRYQERSGLQAPGVGAWSVPMLAARLRESMPPDERRRITRRIAAETQALGR